MTTLAQIPRRGRPSCTPSTSRHPGGRELLGGKGVGLAEMAHLGVPVPAGFTITTDACRAYLAGGGELPAGLEDEIAEHIERLEQRDRTRASATRPTRCSSRSAPARRSRCPG